MNIAFCFQAAITFPAIGKNGAARFNCLRYKTMKAFSGGVRDSVHTNSSDRFPSLFRGHYNQGLFEGLSSSNSFFKTSQVSFINLDSSRQPIPARPDHSSSDFMKPSPRRFVATKAEDTLEPETTCPILLGNNPPYGSKPDDQRLSSSLKDGSGNYGCLVSAIRTLKERISNWPSFCSAATRAPKSIRPTQTKQVRTARLLGEEAGLKFSKGAGIVFHAPIYYI